jgi:hypothetical protein
MTTRFDYATIKYNSNGDTVWVRRYDGPAHSYDEASCLAVDGNGNVYVTGKSASSLPPYINYDYLTIKYSPSGEILWTRRYSSSGNSDDIPTSLVLDGSGSVYVTGSSEDYTVTVKYNTTGDEQWVAKYRFGLTTSPVGIYLDATGNVIVAGTSSGSGWSTFTTIKYNQTPNAVREFSDAIPTTFALEQNYPNPFNPSTTIRYALPSSAHVRLTVYNLLGQVVSELVNEEQTAGWKEVLWNARQTTGGQASNFASGMYFCKLQAENFMEIKKMLLLR